MNKSWFYVLMILAMIFWGMSWVNVKILSSYINAYEVVFFRLGLSLLSMIPVLWYFKLKWTIDTKSFFLSLMSSFVLILYSLLFFYGVKYGTAGLGGALVTTLIPINTFILVAFIQKKIINLKHSFALVLGGFGVLTMLDIYSFNLAQIFAKHNLFFLSASVCWPLLTIISAKTIKIHPLISTFYIYALSTVILYIFFIDISIFHTIWQFDYIFWLNMGIISLLSTTFATSIYFVGVEKLGTKKVSSFIFLVPSSALIFGALFLEETITFNIIIGTICALIAIYILNDLRLKKKA